MAQRTTNRTTTTARPSRSARRLNRAEQQALEIREARTVTGTAALPARDDAPERPVLAGRTRRRRESAATLRVNSLTREQEYGFIRMDLRRLLILSGALIVTMIVVLFAIEAIV